MNASVQPDPRVVPSLETIVLMLSFQSVSPILVVVGTTRICKLPIWHRTAQFLFALVPYGRVVGCQRRS
jgi:hypothetical protein